MNKSDWPVSYIIVIVINPKKYTIIAKPSKNVYLSTSAIWYQAKMKTDPAASIKPKGVRKKTSQTKKNKAVYDNINHANPKIILFWALDSS